MSGQFQWGGNQRESIHAIYRVLMAVQATEFGFTANRRNNLMCEPRRAKSPYYF